MYRRIRAIANTILLLPSAEFLYYQHPKSRDFVQIVKLLAFVHHAGFHGGFVSQIFVLAQFPQYSYDYSVYIGSLTFQKTEIL